MEIENQTDLRHSGIYSCQAVCDWLQNRAGLPAGSAKWRRVLAGDDSVQVGSRVYRFESLNEGVPKHDVDQQFKAYSVDKAELDHLLGKLEEIAPTRGLNRMLVGFKSAIWAFGAAVIVLAAESYIVLPSIASLVIVTIVGTIGGYLEYRRGLDR